MHSKGCLSFAQLQQAIHGQQNIIQSFTEAITNLGSNSIKVKLSQPFYDPATCSKDRYGFQNFLTKFENFVAAENSNKNKLQILFSSLQGRAYDLVKHLSLHDGHYEEAIVLLKTEYANADKIISQIFKDLVTNNPTYIETKYEGLLQYFSDVKGDLMELKTVYQLDFISKPIDGLLLQKAG